VSKSDAAPAAPIEPASQNLLRRIGAALVLAPLALALAYAGGWWWAGLVTLASIGLFIEWLTVVGASQDRRSMMVGIVALVACGTSLALSRVDLAMLALLLGGLAVALLVQTLRLWTTAGFCYAALAELAAVLVRLDMRAGFSALLLVLLVVWGNDIGGYFAGRGVGGPKLWPRVSPKKTWAGAIGGFASGVLLSAGYVAWLPGGTLAPRMVPVLLLAATLSVVSQCGDLFESAVKRRFGVKDSSHIIPGHGGLLDRLDGFVAAIVVAALVGYLRGGVDGVGRGLMVW
jgi:phosphatidate cytidylyltransferase